MSRSAIVLGISMLLACVLAQEFEVASIKVHTPVVGQNERSGIDETKALVRIENLSLRTLIQRAYEIKDYQLSGPDWLRDTRFDIVAKVSEGYTHEQVGPLLRNLLAQRFKLVVHHDSKEISAFALVVAKGGPKLQEDNGPRRYFTIRPGLISGNRTMKDLAGALAGALSRPVADQTDLTGVYDLKVEWTPDQSAVAPGGADEEHSPQPGLSLFTALQELGLRLQTQKAQVDIVVVDHVERTPTEN